MDVGNSLLLHGLSICFPSTDKFGHNTLTKLKHNVGNNRESRFCSLSRGGNRNYIYIYIVDASVLHHMRLVRALSCG